MSGNGLPDKPQSGAGASAGASKLQVELGKDLIAYRCVPINLSAVFKNPGAGGGHRASWTTGDGPPRAAVVTESADGSGTSGTALLTHRFSAIGTYDTVCTIRDGSGAVAQAGLAVHCVELLNADFEGGFRDWPVGQVANYWQPFAPVMANSNLASVTDYGGIGQAAYSADEFIVHGGQRAQRIGGQRAFRAGLMQLLPANEGWDYQVTVWYQLAGTAGGYARLGVDPAGGVDANGPNVAWSLGLFHLLWAQLAVRVTAKGSGITIFLDAGAAQRGGKAVFDDVEVIPYPCRLKIPASAPNAAEKGAGGEHES